VDDATLTALCLALLALIAAWVKVRSCGVSDEAIEAGIRRALNELKEKRDENNIE